LETNEAYEIIIDIITKRWNIIYDPVIEIAYLLDSRFQGKNLSNDIMTIVSDFIEKFYPENSTKIYEQLLEYLAHTGPFNNNLAWETVYTTNQLTWWTGNFKNSAPELTLFAKRILTIPTSSASSERNWSIFAHIHSKNRNRLKSPKILKLVYIYSNYKLKKLQSINQKKLDYIKNKSNLDDNFWEDFFTKNEDNLDLLDEDNELDLLYEDESDFLNKSELEMELEAIICASNTTQKR
ncbi:16712_t:CDS:2, partial [Racocetra fulgida]